MKLVFLLLVAVATVSPAVIRPVRSADEKEALLDVLTRNDEPPAEHVAKLDELLEKVEPQLVQIQEMKPEMRALVEKVALIVVDFELPTEERIKLIAPILEGADLTEEDEYTFRMMAIMTMAITEPISRKIPVAGKTLGTMLVKMVMSNEFLYGTRATRRTLVWKMGRQFGYKMRLDPSLVKEAQELEVDNEIKDVKKKIGIIDF